MEIYAEPGSFTWNMYRRVVKAGEYVVFHMYFDQPVLRVRLWVGAFLTTSVVRHESVAPAYRVYKPCAAGNLAAWLEERGLVALDETFTKPAEGFDADDDFLDATINGNFASRVSVDGGADSAPCSGFWALKGPGGFRVKRLCARRKKLLDEPGATVPLATCSDAEDRVYLSAVGHVYHQARVVLTDAMLDNSAGAQPDGPIRIKWQAMGAYDGQWGAETVSHTSVANEGFFGAASVSADVADVVARVGPAFNPARSCNRDGVANFDQPGSSVWVAVDSTPPAMLTAAEVAVSVSSPQSDETALVAARGDVVTVTATFDEQIDPNVAPAFFTATGARIEPKQVYYNVVTYELVVGSTVPALDGALQITVGPVADVVGNAQASGFVTAVFAEGKTVTTQSASSAAALDAMWGNGYNVGYSCVTSSDNALDDRVAGPSHTFTLTLQASTALEVASASVAGVAAADDGSDVTVVLGASDSNVANGKVTVTRVVPADATAADNSGFVDGASVNWKLSLVTSTACLGDVGTTCLVKFDVSACPADGELTVAGGVATVAQWEERVYVDLSPPVITSVRLVSSSSPEDGPVVRHSETAAVTFVATEPLVNGGAASLVAPDARLVAESCGEVSYAAASAEVQTAVVPVGNGVAANTYTATFTLDDALAIAPASCQTSLLCLDFLDDATDAAGNALATTRYCLGFGDLLTRREPGWLFYDNVAAPTSVAVAKVRTRARTCPCRRRHRVRADSEAAATHPGSWLP